MNTQNQIKRTLSEPTSIQYVCDLLGSTEILHRSELATHVCEQFVLYDTRGQAQRSGCLKALRELEAAVFEQICFSAESAPPDWCAYIPPALKVIYLLRREIVWRFTRSDMLKAIKTRQGCFSHTGNSH